MADLKARSYEAEIMDDLTLGGKDMDQTLDELEVINRLLGGHKVIINGLEKLLGDHKVIRQLHIADLGCGGGDMLRLLSGWFAERDIEAVLTGVDANAAVTSYAEAHSTAYSNIRYKTADIFSDEFREEKYDIILCSLFCHHFTDEQLVRLFSQLKKQTRTGVIINDLHRHWFAYQSIKYITRFFSKSPLVRHDAALSVARGFLKSELEKIMKEAGITSYSLHWMWAFRWQLVF